MLIKGDPKIYPQKINLSPYVSAGRLRYTVSIGEVRREGVGNAKDGFDSTVFYDAGTSFVWDPESEDLIVSAEGGKIKISRQMRLFVHDKKRVGLY